MDTDCPGGALLPGVKRTACTIHASVLFRAQTSTDQRFRSVLLLVSHDHPFRVMTEREYLISTSEVGTLCLRAGEPSSRSRLEEPRAVEMAAPAQLHQSPAATDHRRHPPLGMRYGWLACPARGRRPGTDWTHSHNLRTPDQPSHLAAVSWYRLRLTVAEMNYATRRMVEVQAPWIADDRPR